jgi:hypothetical protein
LGAFWHFMHFADFGSPRNLIKLTWGKPFC